MTLDQEKELLQKVNQMHTILCTTNGNKGLSEQFQEHKQDYNTFKRNTFIFMAVAVTGTGGVGYGIVRLLLGG